ncbi:SDR family NAD(P)-dependent oxidoreductase [Agromyces ramosus]|uniref:3-oxoacyl-[acyl-carrier protein] reductase n=1 Tax=Agromyces ramosus TaxID=33879 RepID=A0ABU0RE54_9MICO|nr:SDR family oxidoreductase [Agromyces ramosus]MDQ0896047.1 3-oxoacyl-[acyl-carrier protein] reductase [Agromyces ramosus]
MTTSTSLPLAGKTALVTGASRGLGAGVAVELARQGASVAITYWSSPERADSVVKAITDSGGVGYTIRANNAEPEGAREGVRDAVAALGSLDILVNSAGAGWFEPFPDTSDEHIEHTINLNVRGTIYTTHEALKHLPNGGRIVTIGSVTAESIPFPGGAIYGMSKAALVAFTKGLARDLGGRKITANIVQPGPIDTEGNPASGPSGEFLAGLTALGYFATPTDVGGLVAWIASDQAHFMTGSTVTLDGGWTA